MSGQFDRYRGAVGSRVGARVGFRRCSHAASAAVGDPSWARHFDGAIRRRQDARSHEIAAPRREFGRLADVLARVRNARRRGKIAFFFVGDATCAAPVRTGAAEEPPRRTTAIAHGRCIDGVEARRPAAGTGRRDGILRRRVTRLGRGFDLTSAGGEPGESQNERDPNEGHVGRLRDVAVPSPAYRMRPYGRRQRDDE